jgi:hypothetical protein
MMYPSDEEIAATYVESGLCETLEEAMEMLETDGLLDWQQIEAGEEQ